MTAQPTRRTAHASKRRKALVVFMIVLPLVILALVLVWVVRQDTAPAGTTVLADDGARSPVSSFFLSAAVVLICCFAAGRLASALGQPKVMGEIAAGILLGPSLLGAVSPDLFAWLFPEDALPLMTGVAQVGLVLFMFGVGQELASVRLHGTTHQVLMISQASLLLPLSVGAAAALLLIDGFKPQNTHPGAFVVFVGCALSITAFPVLAQIIKETRLSATRPGQLSLVVTAVGDLGSWIILGAVITVAHGSGLLGVTTASLAALCLTAVFLGPLRSMLRRWASTRGSLRTAEALMGLTIAVMATAALTSSLGVHQLIGALLVGLVWPMGHPAFVAATSLVSGIRPILLPFFFFGFGLTIDLTTFGLGGGSLLVLLGLFFLAASTKVFGSGLAARLTGLSWRDSGTIGVLLNTRGLTELVVLQTGYEAGLIGPELLAVLTVVALLTTFMTGPLLRLLGVAGGEGEPDAPKDTRGEEEHGAAAPHTADDEGTNPVSPVGRGR